MGAWEASRRGARRGAQDWGAEAVAQGQQRASRRPGDRHTRQHGAQSQLGIAGKQLAAVSCRHLSHTSSGSGPLYPASSSQNALRGQAGHGNVRFET